ncbi:cytochrome P450 2F2-like [Clupea harengus]|uniref:Cytochrome P450 2F2-like n=1 Tax=Clupea harengus TaxID=7950 RepID=A0A6P3WAU2_CLUHA|nr:cytochrome P450 2F2-like [Clupea harengus]
MVVSLILLWIGFCLLLFLIRTRRPKNFPPGPQPFPIFGNLLQLNLENPVIDLQKLSERYGKVFSLYFGGRPAVIITGVEAMREALVTKAVDFAGRPDGVLLSHLTQGKGIIMADYGPGWKEHRRFALTTLRNLGLGKQSMEERILGEVSHISAHLEKCAGQPIDPQTLFHNASCDIICSIMFGSRYEYDHKFFQAMIKMMADNSKIANGPWGMIYDTMPLLRYLPLPFQNALRDYHTIKMHVLDVVNEHRATHTPKEPRDLIDSYLDEVDKRGKDCAPFDDGQMLTMLLDLLFAGTDTTSNTIRSAVLYFMAYPDIQAKCQQEIDMVLEGKDEPCFEDRHHMPYTQAVIHESQRSASTLPLSVFHCTTKDTGLMGYDIPKGTLVIQNLSSALYEEKHWKSPHSFDPSNFLNEQGQFEKPPAFMPFSIGPRTCLGEGLARMELFLILVTLLRRFQFIWPEDAGEPDFTPVFGVTQAPKPYRMVVKLREIMT